MIRRGFKKRIISAAVTATLLFTMLPTSMLGTVGAPEVKAASGHAVYQPISIASGFNADVFAESSSVLSGTNTVDGKYTVSSGNFAFYTQSYTASGGFPNDGIIRDNSGFDNDLYWQLAPYNKANTLRLFRNQSGTFTFNTVGVYQEIYFLCTAGGVGVGNPGKMDVDVYYSDNTIKTASFEVADWFDSTNYARADIMRISNGGIGGSLYGGPYVTRCRMSGLDTTKLIQKITISNNVQNNGVVICVFALTGLTGDVAAPTNTKMDYGCASFTASWDAVAGAKDYRIDIAKDENFTQIVGTYNNTVVNTNNCTITGLEKGQAYFLRVRAADSNGAQSISSAVKSVTPQGHQYLMASVASINDEELQNNPHDDLDTISMYCERGVCDYSSEEPNDPVAAHGIENGYTVTLNASDVYYDRNRHPATIDADELIMAQRLANGANAQQTFKMVNNEIRYYKVNGLINEDGQNSLLQGYAKDENGYYTEKRCPVAGGAPRDIGDYFAEVTFTITHNNPEGGTSTITQTIQKAYSILKDEANYEYEEINENFKTDIYGDNLRDVLRTKVIQSDPETLETNLRVYLPTANEEVTIYKIADLNWNENNGDYDDLVWTDEVEAWVKNAVQKDVNDANPTQLYNSYAYSSPEALKTASASVWKDFYGSMLKDGVTHKKTDGEGQITVVTDTKPIWDESWGESKLLPYEDGTRSYPQTAAKDASTGDLLSEADEGEYKGMLYTDFLDLEFGTYAILAKSSNSSTGSYYNPLVINIVPDRSSPWGSYYIDPWFYANLKAQNGNVEKYINNKKADTIHYGEEVNFSIDVELPTFYPDRVTVGDESVQSGLAAVPYTMYFKDVLSEGYDFPGQSDIKISYWDGEKYVQYKFDETQPTVSYTEFSNRQTIGSASYLQILSDWQGEAYMVEEGDFNYGIYGNDTKLNTELISTTNPTYVRYTENRPLIKSVTLDRTDNVLQIEFDVAALKAFQKKPVNRKYDMKLWNISYTATVNTEATNAKQGNPNTAYIYYERNSTGTNVGSINDKVSGYTYGLRLIKLDGDTLQPLEGARFKIYQEIATYKKTDEAGSHDGYKFLNLYGKAETDISEANSEPEILASENIGRLPESRYYIYEFQDTNGTKDTADDRTLVKVFEIIYGYSVDTTNPDDRQILSDQAGTLGEFESKATANGVVVNGLDVGNYVLVESAPKQGYNNLQEDLLFAIYPLTEEESIMTYNGGYYAFHDGELYQLAGEFTDESEKDADGYLLVNGERVVDTATINESGELSYTVYNYKGITLPATGGAGVWIYIIVGMALMGLVVYIVIRRRNDE